MSASNSQNSRNRRSVLGFQLVSIENKCYKKQKNENLIISELWLRKENDEHVNVAIIPDVFGVKTMIVL